MQKHDIRIKVLTEAALKKKNRSASAAMKAFRATSAAP